MNQTELPKAYDAGQDEDQIYAAWEESGFFNPDNLPNATTPYTIAMPPPNVTGILHLGHALENTLMDITIRHRRMLGYKALLVPGTDHAAVATQARVEDRLKKQGIKNPRQELGREKLLAEIRDYAEKSQATILSQIKKMGTSCDWSRLAYTFDEPRSLAVYEMFKRMYQDGLIYRGYRVVNWSVKGQSTASDDELVYIDQKTKVYTFRYAPDFPISIATTRPETKLGDTAVAVHPADKRYQQYIGQKFTVDVGALQPLTITVIADPNVDPNYGTGAVGVTPAHSQIDFEMYQANPDIGLIQVIGTDGRMTAAAGSAYAGLTVEAARQKFVKWLKQKDLLIGEEEIEHNVGTSDRFGDVVEALPLEQWFIDVNKKIPGRNKSLKDLMREAVTVGHDGDRNKKIAINPKQFQKIYLQWIDNLRDWNISRQIWWGHRVPVWYKGSQLKVSLASPGAGWTQDEDTLDTWFSSGTWTFSTFGWPEKTADLKTYHPTSWLQLGYEILFFWMARMILMSTYALDDIPFREVYIHGILRDEAGKKFSKSEGRGLDPLEIIKRYGTDALRLSLIKGVTPGNDARFYEEKVASARNFVNKLWNISRFILSSVERVELVESAPPAASLADRWILEKLNQTIAAVSADLNHYNFSLASEKLLEFTRDQFADWYLEAAKVEKGKDQILLYVLQNLLKLWHPFCPFVTETIWRNLSDNLLLVAKWPTPTKVKKDQTERDFSAVMDAIVAIRNLRAENRVAPKTKIKVTILAGRQKELFAEQAELIKSLRTGVATLAVTASGDKPRGSAGAVVGGVEIYLDLTGIIDLVAEQKRLRQEITKVEKFLKALEGKLANQDFVANAPAAVVAGEREKLTAQQAKLAKLTAQLNNLT